MKAIAVKDYGAIDNLVSSKSISLIGRMGTTSSFGVQFFLHQPQAELTDAEF